MSAVQFQLFGRGLKYFGFTHTGNNPWRLLAVKTGGQRAVICNPHSNVPNAVGRTRGGRVGVRVRLGWGRGVGILTVWHATAIKGLLMAVVMETMWSMAPSSSGLVTFAMLKT